MYTFEEFEADAVRAFAFLETEHAMRRRFERAGIAAWLTYQNTIAGVSVYYEVGSGVTTSIEDVAYSRKPLDTSRSFSVFALTAGRQTTDSPTLPQAIAEQAEILRKHGQNVLAGDFSELHAKHDRLVAATLANRETSSN